MKRLFHLINKPMPAWLTLLLLTAALPAMAASPILQAKWITADASATPSPAPTGFRGPVVVAQATAAPTPQTGNINVSGSIQSQGTLVPPVYGSQTGTGIASGAHGLSFLVQGGVGGIAVNTLVGGVCSTYTCYSVTGFSLSGNSAYSSATSYSCSAVDLDAIMGPLGADNTSGTVFNLTVLLPAGVTVGSSDHFFVRCFGS